jgi:hypothetical protein
MAGAKKVAELHETEMEQRAVSVRRFERCDISQPNYILIELFF